MKIVTRAPAIASSLLTAASPLVVGLVLALAPLAATAKEPIPDDVAAAQAAAWGRLASAVQGAAELSSVVGAPVFDAQAPRIDKSFSNARVELLADRRALVPGEPVRLAFRIDLDPQWHVYHGLNPGSIGLPTEVIWRLPEGMIAEPVRWPAPELYRESSGDLSYVHHDDLVLSTTLTVPPLPAGTASLTLGAEYDFQFCFDKCIRKSGELDLTLPVADTAAPGAGSEFAELFEAAEAARMVVDSPHARGAVSHSPLVADGALAVVLELEPSAPGVRLERPADTSDRPLVVFDRVRGVEAETLEVLPTAAGGLRIVARLSAGEKFDPTTPVPEGFGASVQVLALQDGADAAPMAYRVALPLALAPGGTEVVAQESELLADVNVAAIVGAASSGGDDDAGLGAMGAPPPPLPLWQALLFALLGGLILNIMPCVLPVLSLKALALVEEANASQRSIRSFIGAYVLGVLFSFWVLAGVVIAVKMSGQLVGWGFQFQEPGYVLVMVAVIFAFALSLFGVFEIPGLTVGGGAGGGSAGLRGSFVHGMLTTALSTPCSAPLLGSALTFALAQSPAMIVLSFTLIGVGLALPVSILTLAPAARRFIPRPGPWMETFKHVVAFLLVGTAIWLLSVLTSQVSSGAMLGVYILLGLVAFAAWVLGRFTGPLASGRRKIAAVVVASGLIVGGASNVSLEPPPEGAEVQLATELIAWEPFAGEETMALAAEGHTLFIDFTAEWCATCKTMEATAIETEAVSQLMRENRIRPFKADLTRKNPELNRWVERFGRSAIPLYVIVPAGKPGAPVVLPEVITEGMLLDALRKAGASTAGVQSRAPQIVPGPPGG